MPDTTPAAPAAQGTGAAFTTLITGAAGFAGSHLLDLLATDTTQAGAGLVAWRRPHARFDGVAPTFSGRLRWEEVDILDRAAVRAAIARLRPSRVYHCAGAAHVGRAWDRVETTFATNVRGTHHLLDALTRAGIEARVFIPSSALVYAQAGRALTEDDSLTPSSPYGLSKLAQEMLARHADAGLTVTLARAFNHLGPRQDPLFAAAGFARRIADIERGLWEAEISVGNLDARRDLTDVRDTVRAYRLILERGAPGEVFNVCSGHAVPIRQVLEMLIARATVPVRIRVDPSRYRPNDTPLLLGDPARIRQRLGWSPRMTLDRTLDDLLEYWRAGERTAAERLPGVDVTSWKG
jgi:GDP-4-dehydro-6-deoxy-D-mannose reductase